jgi:hypothetical protein
LASVSKPSALLGVDINLYSYTKSSHFALPGAKATDKVRKREREIERELLSSHVPTARFVHWLLMLATMTPRHRQFGNGGNLENFDVGQYLIDVGHFDVEAVTKALRYGTVASAITTQPHLLVKKRKKASSIDAVM